MNDLERLRVLQGRLARLNRKRIQVLTDLKNIERLYEQAKTEAEQLAKQIRADS